LPEGDSEIFGVIMDWEIGGGFATLVVFKTGYASIYLSSGGGVIGGGPNPNVNRAAKLFVDQAKNYFDKSNRMYAIPLAEKKIAFVSIFSLQKGNTAFKRNLKISKVIHRFILNFTMKHIK